MEEPRFFTITTEWILLLFGVVTHDVPKYNLADLYCNNNENKN